MAHNGAFQANLGYSLDPSLLQHGALSMHAERTGGYLLRTKSSESHEGGVAVGYSVIDTPLLV